MGTRLQDSCEAQSPQYLKVKGTGLRQSGAAREKNKKLTKMASLDELETRPSFIEIPNAKSFVPLA